MFLKSFKSFSKVFYIFERSSDKGIYHPEVIIESGTGEEKLPQTNVNNTLVGDPAEMEVTNTDIQIKLN